MSRHLKGLENWNVQHYLQFSLSVSFLCLFLYLSVSFFISLSLSPLLSLSFLSLSLSPLLSLSFLSLSLSPLLYLCLYSFSLYVPFISLSLSFAVSPLLFLSVWLLSFSLIPPCLLSLSLSVFLHLQTMTFPAIARRASWADGLIGRPLSFPISEWDVSDSHQLRTDNAAIWCRFYKTFYDCNWRIFELS